ncbi:MAG TPA: vanadium-dependent haloperoxidase [Candidatus Limnocylindria bacterium]|nr:vanadium-dependent haloperoxidase [Candidatus Limnocylindria bacterium]
MRLSVHGAAHLPRAVRRIAPTLLLTLSLVAGSPASAAEPQAGGVDPAVITTWNANAVATLVQPAPAGAAKVPPEAFLYLSFVHIAMYNAVNGITGEYELYRWHGKPADGASPEAAAAAAAHRVLRTYFGAMGTIGADLDAKLAASLALIPDGAAKNRGVRYGERAADRIIELRANDGRNAVVTVPTATDPGDWEPTPPAMAPFLNPWYGHVDPLAITSPEAFDPGPPPQIGSKRYRKEFAETRDYGSLVSSFRTPEQEATAKFIAEAPLGPMQGGLRRLAMEQGMDISDSARLFAVTEVSLADALMAVWHAKHEYMWWRPITAIRNADSDGDSTTVGVSDWTPLLATPPYPEWPSGLNAVIGSVTTAAKRLNGGVFDLHLVTPTQGERHYTDVVALRQDGVNARVWSGIHFRTSDRVSIQIGRHVAEYVLEHYFRPAD